VSYVAARAILATTPQDASKTRKRIRVVTEALEDYADELYELGFAPNGTAWTEKSCPACCHVRRLTKTR
jgi:hypothetical protein